MMKKNTETIEIVEPIEETTFQVVNPSG